MSQLALMHSDIGQGCRTEASLEAFETPPKIYEAGLKMSEASLRKCESSLKYSKSKILEYNTFIANMLNCSTLS